MLALSIGIAVFGGFLVALWFSVLIWTYRDIRSRTEDFLTIAFSLFLVLAFPFIGLIIYLILRPRETLANGYARSLEKEALLQDLDDDPHCPSCQGTIKPDFLYCPNCLTQLKRACPKCRRPLDLTWKLCPYCGKKEVPEPQVSS
ncbi:MAG: zinc ribbon domain-containing protein [Chloroflexi bacterium]|nr:zinc ribbon domain-containing protein [Chloroflexota bacterium]